MERPKTAPKPRNPLFEGPGAEKLKPRDRELNALAYQFQIASNALHSTQYKLIKVADSENPDDQAELNTDVLRTVKENLSILNELVRRIEAADGVVEVAPQRKQLGKKPE